ncbi:MAG: amidohydrolase [Pseudomonadota bacterium]
MIPLIDCHQHLMYANDVHYPWAENVPAIKGRTFTLEDYKALTDGHGVAGTIFMEVNADSADLKKEAAVVSKVAEEEGSGILGLIAATRPEDPHIVDSDLEIADSLGVVGFRRVLHVVEDSVSQTDTFRQSVKKIGKASKTFDMVFKAHQLPVAYDLAAACDETVLMLDHCGFPDVAAGAIDPWREDTRRLAALPNVWCKLSGILTNTNPGEATYETIRPYIDHLLEVFGPARMVWGSDWPVVNVKADLPTWLGITREILNGLSEDEASSIANGNAKTVYGVSLA